MSYSYTPDCPDADVVADDLEARTNAITGTPPLSAPIVDPDFKAFLQAQADSLLSSVGYQTHDHALFGVANSSTITTYADVPNSEWTFVAPIAKAYVAHLDFSFFRFSATGWGIFRIVANGTNGPDNIIVPPATNVVIGPFHLMLPATMAAGNNSLKLQWKVDTAGTQINVDNAKAFRHWLVTG